MAISSPKLLCNCLCVLILCFLTTITNLGSSSCKGSNVRERGNSSMTFLIQHQLQMPQVCFNLIHFETLVFTVNNRMHLPCCKCFVALHSLGDADVLISPQVLKTLTVTERYIQKLITKSIFLLLSGLHDCTQLYIILVYSLNKPLNKYIISASG